MTHRLKLLQNVQGQSQWHSITDIYYELHNILGIYLQNTTKPRSYTFDNVNSTLWQETLNTLHAQQEGVAW